jgi:SPP1 family predicted phage head-tail adaptor
MLNSKQNIGKLDRRIVIQQSTESKDIYGQPVKTWAALATVWAQVEDRTGSEGVQAEQITASRTTVFTIRYLSTVAERMRILYNFRYYDIHSIKSPDRNRFLELSTELLDDPFEEEGAEFSSAFSSAFNV